MQAHITLYIGRKFKQHDHQNEILQEILRL